MVTPLVPSEGSQVRAGLALQKASMIGEPPWVLAAISGRFTST